MELFPDDMNPIFTTPVRLACPSCGMAPLGRVADCDMVHWLCGSCGHCWQERRGRLHAVNPIACPGCSSKPRSERLVLLGREFRLLSGREPRTAERRDAS